MQALVPLSLVSNHVCYLPEHCGLVQCMLSLDVKSAIEFGTVCLTLARCGLKTSRRRRLDDDLPWTTSIDNSPHAISRIFDDDTSSSNEPQL